MKCEDCPYRLTPFFWCSKMKQPLKDKHTEIRGCNIDGELPPLPVVVPPNVRRSEE